MAGTSTASSTLEAILPIVKLKARFIFRGDAQRHCHPKYMSPTHFKFRRCRPFRRGFYVGRLAPRWFVVANDSALGPGALKVHNVGLGQDATFTLELSMQPMEEFHA